MLKSSLIQESDMHAFRAVIAFRFSYLKTLTNLHPPTNHNFKWLLNFLFSLDFDNVELNAISILILRELMCRVPMSVGYLYPWGQCQ